MKPTTSSVPLWRWKPEDLEGDGVEDFEVKGLPLPKLMDLDPFTTAYRRFSFFSWCFSLGYSWLFYTQFFLLPRNLWGTLHFTENFREPVSLASAACAFPWYHREDHKLVRFFNNYTNLFYRVITQNIRRCLVNLILTSEWWRVAMWTFDEFFYNILG